MSIRAINRHAGVVAAGWGGLDMQGAGLMLSGINYPFRDMLEAMLKRGAGGLLSPLPRQTQPSAPIGQQATWLQFSLISSRRCRLRSMKGGGGGR
jgi:hypothetical protein